MDFSQQDRQHINVSKGERWASLAAGLLFLLYALKRRTGGALISALAGAGLLYRGATGQSILYDRLGRDTAAGEKSCLEVITAVTVNRPASEVYGFWRNLENLPRFMHHLESVQASGNGRSHWRVKAPAGMALEWDARISDDRPNERIAWETLPDSTVQHRGQVFFRPEPHGWGTEVVVALHYRPPGGIVGEAFAHVLNVVTDQQIKEEIRRFKHIMEAGEIPTIEGQPSGRD